MEDVGEISRVDPPLDVHGAGKSFFSHLGGVFHPPQLSLGGLGSNGVWRWWKMKKIEIRGLEKVISLTAVGQGFEP